MKRFLAFMLIIFCIFSAIAALYIHDKGVKAQTLYWGSRGDDVYELQRKLKQWGYYTGPVDGYFGAKTHKAVVYFQRKNGLRVDGLVGRETRRALGMAVTTNYAASRGISNRDDLYLLAQLITGEARGEPYLGQVAVGAVVLNRVEHPSFPKTIAGVIFQPGAFTAVSDGQMFRPPTSTAIRAAADALNGWDPTWGALYYYNPARTTNRWIWSRPVHLVIGKHRFAR